MGIEYGAKNLYKAYGVPALDLTFANKKSLVDRISGNNLITSTRSSTATYIGADGLVKYASANEGRPDHDQTTGESLGLLIEEARTNYIGNNTTNLFTMAYSNWTSDSSITYPDGGTIGGYNTFDQLSGARFFIDFNPAGNTTYSCSVWARLKSGSTATTVAINVKDYQSDTVRGISDTITLTNTWKRISVTGTTAGTSGLRFEIGVNTSGASSQVYFWGAQVEVGAYSTSYIPTTTAAVTRADDVPVISGSNFTRWFNASAGTFFCEWKSAYPGNERILNFGAGPTSTIMSNEGVLGSGLYFSSLQQAPSTTSANGIKIAVATSVSESAGAYSGNSAVSTGACSYYASASSLNFVPGAAAIRKNWIKRVIYWPTRLSNAQLQAITA
jgi:hypothetical protein